MGAAPSPPPLELEPREQDAVRETHCSRILLRGDKAYKLRKPLRFAFVDQSTVQRRRALAEAEVAINAELAPGVYLGVADVRDHDGGVEPAVVMRRFDEADTLAARLAAGRVAPDALAALGRRLAVFHASCAVVEGGARAALARVDRNMEELTELVSPAVAWRVARPLQAALLRRATLLEERAAGGRWRDGHGDLRAEHVLLDAEGVRVVDRLEFDPALRADDVACDLAFLLMDLEARGARWAAEAVAQAYREAGGDAGDDALLAVWAAYRATVSAKVALLRARQQTGDDAARSEALAHERLALAGRLLWRARRPLVLVVCGAPATGKSTLASELAQRSGAEVVASDRVRKARLGLAPTMRADEQAYTSAVTAEVFAEVGRRAAAAVEADGVVVVDATMATLARRIAFFEGLRAERVLPRVAFVECSAPAKVAEARAHGRAADSAAVSDATAAIAAQLRAAWEPLDEVPPSDHLILRTDQKPDAAADVIERWLDAVP